MFIIVHKDLNNDKSASTFLFLISYSLFLMLISNSHLNLNTVRQIAGVSESRYDITFGG